MIIEPGFIFFLVWFVTMAGPAVCVIFFVIIPSVNMVVIGMFRIWNITATGNIMFDALVAGGTGEVRANCIHVYIEITARHCQRVVHIAVFDAITATAIEVTGATGVTAGLANILCDICQVDS